MNCRHAYTMIVLVLNFFLTLLFRLYILSMCTFHNIDPVIDAIETSRTPWWRLVFVAHILLLLLLLLLCPAPIRRGIKRWWPSYVCPSACLSRPQRFWPSFENGKTYSKLKIGKKEAHDTDEPWPHLDVERSRSPDRLTPWPKITYVFGTGRLSNFKLGVIRMKYDDPHHRRAR